MINVNQITSQLARMPDQALQQYAMMHKNDPYTVSLALSESNRRKQMRDAAQGQQGMAPQPKVVDQGIAGMMPQAPQPQMPPPQAQPMPEDVGIGALPAPNMQGMAGGGIVAFGGGGDVQRFDNGGAVDAARARREAAQQKLYTYGLRQRRDDPQGFMAAQNEFNEARQAATAAETAYATQLAGTGVNQAARGLQDVGATNQFSTLPVTVPAAAPVVISNPTDQRLANKTQTAPTNTILPAPGAVPSAGGPRPAPAPAAPRAAVVPAGDYLTQLDAMKARAGDVVDPTALLKQNQTTKEVQAEEAALAKRKIEQKAEFEEMFKGKEERIGKREAELGKSKDTNTGMAFLEAGLAMMQARGPGLAGIAQGAGVGLKQYASGIKDIKAAQEKLDDARDRIEELRQNQSSMNKSEVRNAEKGIRAIVNQGDRDLIKGVETATGVQREDFRAAVTSNMARAEAERNRNFQAEQGGLDRLSRERAASAPSGVERMARDLGGKDGLEAGLKKYSEIMGPEGKGLATLIANYAKDPTALKLLEATDPALAKLIKDQMQNMLLQPSNTPTGTGQVRVGQ